MLRLFQEDYTTTKPHGCCRKVAVAVSEDVGGEPTTGTLSVLSPPAQDGDGNAPSTENCT
jgi:hypothetical protein